MSSERSRTLPSIRCGFNASECRAHAHRDPIPIQSGGILVPGRQGGTITGGTLTAPGGGELIAHGYNTFFGFAINSALASTVGLTKTGPGTLTLGGNNTGLTGPDQRQSR